METDTGTSKSKVKYYDVSSILTYNAHINMVITARGKGKTYGFRKKAIKDYLKDGSTFVEMVRYNKQLKDVGKGYFDKLQLNNEFPEWIFKVNGDLGFIAKNLGTDSEGKQKHGQWKLLCYFVSLNDQQNAKKRTFSNVKNIIFDEFILEKRTFPGYLPGEYRKFVNLLDTIIREVPGEGTKARVFMLANACDLVNPYFTEFGITDEPPAGYKWIVKNDVLLHYDKDPIYTEAKRQTLVGRLSRGHNEDMITNVFTNASHEFIGTKSKNAKFKYAFIYSGKTYAVWIDYSEGYYYINNKIPNNAERVYALTKADNSPNLLLAKKNEHMLKTMLNAYYANLVQYDTPATREGFLNMLSLFGVR